MSTAPQAAKPTKHIFDAFNSSATGHQKAENRLSDSTSWRDSRNKKLREQYSGGRGGGKRVSDTVGAGSLDFGQDGRTENGGWVKGAKGLRSDGQKSIVEMGRVSKDTERPSKRVKLEEDKPTKLVNPWTPVRKEDGSIRETSWTSHESSPSHLLSPLDSIDSTPQQQSQQDAEEEGPEESLAPQIFRSLCFYINGSTMPTISDHRLKFVIRNHGGDLSIALGRRSVTHVIIGKTSAQGGCGGGLAGSKIQKEIARQGGNAVNYVTAEWVTESIKAGKRLPESRFKGLKLAPKGVNGIASMFAKVDKKASASTVGKDDDRG
ncbi:hypothetical protein KC332_g10271 [Hortaea werneckii]|nr:hypothetical protein KC350_g9320 [Hortaea werneckii]KAI6828430.1 hypothetical protein KC358_g7269 [Hortaea werneckii]KAI6929707.1 hypothetical protein KC348_g7770 [Hortaea werneckii]KAI6934994.1 hypothetical protein KC341_g7221 [Hortaea werneckii]KAI6969722.1 hypothetical protein KC321_g7726 [Hortaea werneckii]